MISNFQYRGAPRAEARGTCGTAQPAEAPVLLRPFEMLRASEDTRIPRRPGGGAFLRRRVNILEIPRGLVINRSDMGDDRVREYAKSEGVPILMEIPFDRKIAESYSKGEMLVVTMPEWKQKFKDLFHRIEEILSHRKSGGS